MPPSRRMRQKWTAIKMAASSGTVFLLAILMVGVLFSLLATSLADKPITLDVQGGPTIPEIGLMILRAAKPDVVIGVGASLNRHTLENGYMYPNAKYVHIDQKAHLMMGGGKAADAYVQSDAKIGVEELEKEFQKKIVIKADPNLHQEQYEVVMV